MRQFGLIGYPLSHSFSPAYFARKFRREHIGGCDYQAYPIGHIDQLPALVANPDLEGLNVTIPYKKQVIPLLTSTSDAVAKMGACNCIKIRNGELHGYNTDVDGFEQSLLPKLAAHHNRALVLGTGGAAAAVRYVLEKLHIPYLSVSTSMRSDTIIPYETVTADIIDSHPLIINTTPLGMYPNVDEAPAIPYELLTQRHYLFDLVYNPAETLFLKRGAERGAAIKNGADMLEIQAEESWKIWNS